MTATATEYGRSASTKSTHGFVDADVHNTSEKGTIERYLPAKWHRHYQHDLLRNPAMSGFWHGWAIPGGSRPDTVPPTGGPPASDLDFMREQLLDRWDAAFALLNPIEHYSHGSGEFGLALAAAINEWNKTEWLERDSRLVASLAAPFEDAELAAAEIERWGDDPSFVAVSMPVLTREPMGHSKYWKMYEAAAEHRLPMVVHVAGFGGFPTTGAVGYGSYFLESHTGWVYPFLSHVVSLVTSGVFERIPGLQVVLTEGGFAWMSALMWRLDRAWQMMPDEWPSLRYEPSRYIREHFWFTTQPIDEPEKPQYLLENIAHMDMADRILFSSDYPHWDFDAPDLALPASLPAELKDRILRRNAYVAFQLPQ